MKKADAMINEIDVINVGQFEIRQVARCEELKQDLIQLLDYDHYKFTSSADLQM
jgi:hypothetical protein